MLISGRSGNGKHTADVPDFSVVNRSHLSSFFLQIFRPRSTLFYITIAGGVHVKDFPGVCCTRFLIYFMYTG